MKAVIMEEHIDREYYLGYWIKGYITFNGEYEFNMRNLSVDSDSLEVGCVTSKNNNVRWKIHSITDSFQRELTARESIQLVEGDFSITKVVHHTNGNIIYYTDKKVVHEDLESKKKAEYELETRILIMKERERVKETSSGVINVNGSAPWSSEKKWYQFWK